MKAVSAQVVSCCVYDEPQQLCRIGNIQYLFGFWADPFVDRHKSVTNSFWANVVAQLVQQALVTPEVCSSNPVIVKLLHRTFVYCQLNWKDDNKRKRGREWPFQKNSFFYRPLVHISAKSFKNISNRVILYPEIDICYQKGSRWSLVKTCVINL